MRLQSATVSLYLQHQLRKKGLDRVAPVEAAKWLHRAGILKDSSDRPGLPLRNLLRAKSILGQHQESNRRWFIERVDFDDNAMSGVEE